MMVSAQFWVRYWNVLTIVAGLAGAAAVVCLGLEVVRWRRRRRLIRRALAHDLNAILSLDVGDFRRIQGRIQGRKP